MTKTEMKNINCKTILKDEADKRVVQIIKLAYPFNDSNVNLA